ncbi:unnamed protein product [Closterium sp. Yama58-4]|nr:unnamed protein product [Closterium sp. Yama58-4]
MERKYQEEVMGEMGRTYQNEMLRDVSTGLERMKEIAIAMGTKIDEQNEGLEHLTDDVSEANSIVRQAKKRADDLLKKR